MTPTFHPPDDLLVEYAAGETPESVSLVIACHATLCPTCRRQLEGLDAVGGALLEQAPLADLPARALERTLAAIDSGGPELGPDPGPTAALPDLGVPLPRPLLRYLGSSPAWKRVVPGIGGIKLPVDEAGTLIRLVRLRPGLTIPLHDHGGPELTMVFSGGLVEPERTLHRGDFSLRQAGEEHVQRVKRDGPCIALTVNQGPLLPRTWFGRVLVKIARD